MKPDRFKFVNTRWFTIFQAVFSAAMVVVMVVVMIVNGFAGKYAAVCAVWLCSAVWATITYRVTYKKR